MMIKVFNYNTLEKVSILMILAWLKIVQEYSFFTWNSYVFTISIFYSIEKLL